MKEFSVGAILACRIAAMEVKAAKHQYIEKEHLLIGFCSLGKALAFAENFALNAEDQHIVQSEHEAIEGVLDTFEMDTTQLRRQMRRKLGRGSYRRTERVIHRSKACKQVFARAEKLAVLPEHISCLDLLAALLEEPGEIITFIFQETGVAPMDVRQHILTIISPQQATPQLAMDVLQKLSQPGRMQHPKPPSPAQRAETQEPATSSIFKGTAQSTAGTRSENIADRLGILKGFTDWESLREDVLSSTQEGGLLRKIPFSGHATQKQNAIVALHVLTDLKEGVADGERGYNAHRLCRILDVLRTRKEAIFDFLELINAPQQKAIVFRALLDLSDPVEHEYKNLIQRFLCLEPAIDEDDTLEEVLSRAPKALKGTERVLRALHDINLALSAEIEKVLGFRKDLFGALLEALDMAEMRKISEKIGQKITFPLYIGLVFYAIAAKTQGEITVGNFVRKYMCKEVPLFVLLGMLNRNVFAGAYMRSPLVRPEVVGFPMDFAAPRIAIQEILKAFDETIEKSRVTFDKNQNIVLKGGTIEKIPGKILFDTHGNITIDCPVIIRKIGTIRHIVLAPHEGRYKVVRGKVIDTTKHTEIPGPPCNIVYGTEIFLPNTPSLKMIKKSILHIMTPKGVVYGSPEPTKNELKVANALIDRQKKAETKKAQLIEGRRPKPLRSKQLILLYVMKNALEKFYDRYMKNPQKYFDELMSESGVSGEFQLKIDQTIYELLALVFRISGQFSRDRSGGWKKFWELFGTILPEQLCKYIEMTTEFKNTTTFMAPVLGIQRELGEVYWNLARLMLVKGGHRVPPIPRATSPSGRYKEILENIQREVHTDDS